MRRARRRRNSAFAIRPAPRAMVYGVLVCSSLARGHFAIGQSVVDVPVVDVLAASEPSTAQIQLVNGDALLGALLDCDRPDMVRWQSPIFSEPLLFPTGHIAAAQFARSTPVEGAGDFALELLGGDLLLGTMVDWTPDRIVFDSLGWGSVALSPSHAARLVRWGKTSGIEYLGPQGVNGWLQKHDAWRAEAGHLLTHRRGAAYLSEIQIPVQACIEIDVSWQRHADFRIAFGVGPEFDLDALSDGIEARRIADQRRDTFKPTASSLFELDTFSRWMVMIGERSHQADLAPLLKIDSGAGRVQLQIFIDAESGRFAAYSREGKLLGEIAAPPGEVPFERKGIAIVNRSGDVRLERLAVRRWNGALPTKSSRDLAFVQTGDGETTLAASLRFDAQSNEFVVVPRSGDVEPDASDSTGESTAEPIRIAADDAALISWIPSAEAPSGALRVQLSNGERLTGHLRRIAAGRLELARDGFDSVVSVETAQARALVGVHSEWDEKQASQPTGRLEADGVSCRGVLGGVAQVDGKNTLQWRPVMAASSSPLVPSLAAQIIYHEEAAAEKDRRRLQPQPQLQRPNDRNGLLGGIVDILGGGPTADGDAKLDRDASDVRDDAWQLEKERQLLWLRTGDRFPCTLLQIDEAGAKFTASVVDARFLPHDRILAWERRAGDELATISEEKKSRLLTLPRMQRDNPPTHLIESLSGDFLRTRLLHMDATTASVEIQLNAKDLPTNRISRIIWLYLEPAAKMHDRVEPTSVGDGAPPPVAALRVQAIRHDGFRLTFSPEGVEHGLLSGTSNSLGPCRVALSQIDRLLIGRAIDDATTELPFHSWKLQPAPEPRFVDASAAGADSGGEVRPSIESPLVGQSAPDFKLSLLEGDAIRLSELQGSVVVLDFWASWCGPCVQAMPQVEQIVARFADRNVRLLAVNLQEDAAAIRASLERMDASPDVALDVDGAAAAKYAVSAIPQTVVIDAKGLVTGVLIGGGPGVAERLRKLIEQALE